MGSPLDVLGVLLKFYEANEAAGLFLFLLLEESGIPLLLPGDTLIMAAGARPDRSAERSLLIIAVASAAAALGSSLLYAVVRRGGRTVLARFGPYLHLTDRRVATLEGWYRRHGAAAVVVGRLVPGLRTPTTVMAALFGVPYRTFAPATAIAALVWAAMYFFLGALLQRQAHVLAVLLAGVTSAGAMVVAVTAVLSLAAAVAWRRRRRRAHAAAAEREGPWTRS